MILNFKRNTQKMTLVSVFMFFIVGLVFFTISNGLSTEKTSKPSSTQMNTTDMKQYKSHEGDFTLDIPARWNTFPADPKNSPPPDEVIRFVSHEDGIHLLCISRKPGDPKQSLKEYRDQMQQRLAAKGFGNFITAETTIGSRKALILDCDISQGDGTWSLRWYYITEGTLIYGLGLGTTNKYGMFELYNRIAQSFEILGFTDVSQKHDISENNDWEHAGVTDVSQKYCISENNDWERATLAEVGIDEFLLNKMVERIKDNTFKNVHSTLIVKNGKLVYEKYFNGYNKDIIHAIQSATKSVSSLLAGIAIDKKFIKSPEQKLFSFLPEYAELKDHFKENITLKHILTMSIGIEWNEMDGVQYSNPINDALVMNNSDNWIQYTLSKKGIEEPGSNFYYCSGATILLAGIMKSATGVHIDEFAEKHLFQPLDITKYAWTEQKDGLPHAGGGLSIRPRDMAKIGWIYLNGGKWNGQQIVSENWIKDSVKSYFKVPMIGTYGYSWLKRKMTLNGKIIELISAQGYGGQYIIIVPEYDTVIVMTAGNYGIPDSSENRISKYILPAIIG